MEGTLLLLRLRMRKYSTKIMKNSLRICALLAFLCTGLQAQTTELPDTPAGKLFGRFLQAVEAGEIEPFVKSAFTEQVLQRMPAEEHIRFLTMMHRMHGGFRVYEISRSEPNRIEVICQSKQRKAWRLFTLITSGRPAKIAGIDIQDLPPPEAYLKTLPKMQIERPADDDAIVRGEKAQRIDGYMTLLESAGFSGGLLLADKSNILLAKGYGYADREQKKVFDRRTVFTIGSITKQFTGAAIVKLWSMGKIAFTDPISKYFDNVPADKQAITLHNLLTHTAGFPDAIGDDYEKIGRDAFVERAMRTPLIARPGERYHYSNVGFSLLAAIIEKVTGGTYEHFLREQLFLPAGMQHTGYILPVWNENDIVTGYAGDRRWGKPTGQLWGENGPGWHLQGNGGIMSTLDDMYKWGRAVLGNEVFNESEKEKYLTPYVPEGPEADSYYAYGWVRMQSPRGTDVITHNGGNPYIQNDMYIYPREQVIMFITSNNGEFSCLGFSGKILEMFFGAE